MKPTNIKTLHRGFLKVQLLTVENDKGNSRDFERVVHSPAVVGICHDPINDQILLVEQYRYGAMQEMLEFPAGLIDKGEQAHQAVVREIWEEAGVNAKSATLINEYMSMPGSLHAPMSVFYVTFDSREVEDGTICETSEFEKTKVVLKTAKELIREVEANQHPSVPVIIGAQYLKMLHKGLVK